MMFPKDDEEFGSIWWCKFVHVWSRWKIFWDEVEWVDGNPRNNYITKEKKQYRICLRCNKRQEKEI